MTEDRLSTDQTTAPIGQDRARGGTGRARAAIVIVCRDATARETLNRELSRRYGADYQIVVCDGPAELEPRVRNLLDNASRRMPPIHAQNLGGQMTVKRSSRDLTRARTTL